MLVLTITLWFLKTTIGAGNPEGNVHSTVRKKQVIQFPALGIFPSQADALRRRVGWSAVAQDSHRRCGGTLVKIELKNFVWVQKNGWWSFCSLKKTTKTWCFFFLCAVLKWHCFWEDVGFSQLVGRWVGDETSRGQSFDQSHLLKGCSWHWSRSSLNAMPRHRLKTCFEVEFPVWGCQGGRKTSLCWTYLPIMALFQLWRAHFAISPVEKLPQFSWCYSGSSTSPFLCDGPVLVGVGLILNVGSVGSSPLK